MLWLPGAKTLSLLSVQLLSASQTVNIRRPRVLLCLIFSLKRSSGPLKTIHFLCLLLDASLNISTSHFTFTPSEFEVILSRYKNYLLTYLLTYAHGTSMSRTDKKNRGTDGRTTYCSNTAQCTYKRIHEYMEATICSTASCSSSGSSL